MQIQVKIINNKSIFVEVDDTATVKDLKEKIYKQENIPVAHQKLIFSNLMLEDGNRLSDYNVQKNCTVYLIARVADDPNPLNYVTIWRDDNIDNEENSKYRKELEEKGYSGVYFKKTISEALDVIKSCGTSKIKLITNGGVELTGKTLIQEARKITGTNFVSLVFAKSPQHLEWITPMVNILFTTNPEMFKQFVELKMDKGSISPFITQLQNDNKVTFNIDEKDF